jgi:uncharacterized protein involved in type VI secretion and phage assembly
MAEQIYASGLVVEVGGRALPSDVATLLSYAYVDDSRHLPDLFVLRFRDASRAVLAKAGFSVGAPVKLSVHVSDRTSPEVLLDGEVTSLVAELERGEAVTEVRGMDRAYRLMAGSRVAAYADMTVAEIVRQVAERAGLPVGRVDDAPGLAGTAHTQLSQANESDWDFLRRLAERAGAELTVDAEGLHFRVPEPPEGAPEPSAAPRRDPLVLDAHRNVLTLRAVVTSVEQVPEVQVRGWDFRRKEPVTATSPAQTRNTVLDLEPASLARDAGAPPLLDASAPCRSQQAAATVAKALAGQVAEGFAELDGTARGDAKLRAGAGVALAGVGAPFDGKYTLTTTRHTFTAETGYVTAFTVSGQHDRSLYGLIAGTGGGAGPRGGRGGLVPALVCDVRDPDTLGRVRLTFPWLAEEYTSEWARVVQLGAGPDRGVLWPPEVGDEVLVGFEHGDLDAPYVLGGLHNGTDAAPALAETPVDGNSGEIVARGLVGRTGHRLELVESGTGANEVRLATGDGKHSLVLDAKGMKITLHGDGTVLIEGAQGVTVDAKTGPLEMKGGTVKLTSTGPLELSGATMKLASSGPNEITGAIVKIN